MKRGSPVPRTLGEAARVFFSFGSPRLLAAQALGALAARTLLGPPKLADVVVLGGVALYWPTMLAPSAATACTGILCLGAAALSYEWIHFLTHSAYRPSTSWFREVKRRHLAHHYRDSNRWFAFIIPAVDDWLGTGEVTSR